MNPSEEKAKAPEKTKALCVATRCTSVEQFVATFHRFCDESSFFVATLATRPVGLETAFSIQLEDKTPVLRGLCVVVEAWSTPANRFGRPGVRLNVRRLTNDSLPVFKQLQAARIAAEAAERARSDDGRPVEARSFARPATAAERVDAKPGDANAVDAKSVEASAAARPADARPVDARPISVAAAAKPSETSAVDAKEPAAARPVDASPIDPKSVDARPSNTAVAAKPNDPRSVDTKPEKPKTLAEKLAEIKSQPKPPAIPPRKTDGIPPIPSPSAVPPIPPALPKINPTAFAVKPAPSRGANPSPIIVEVEIDEPTKIEAKTAVRAEGTAPVARTLVEPTPEQPAAPSMKPGLGKRPAPFDEATITGPAPTSPGAPGEPAPSANASVAPASAAPVSASASASVITSATSAPMEAPVRPTPPPRAANVTTPAIGISTSTINLSNAALTAEDTHAHAPSYADTASIVDVPPRQEGPPVASAPSRGAHDAKAAGAHDAASVGAHDAASVGTHDARAAGAHDAASVGTHDARAAGAHGKPVGTHDAASVRGNPDAPEAIAASDDMTSPVASEARAPGSSFVLPANPLMNLSDKSLEGFVDCALYEETGNFFRAPGYEESLVDIDDVAAPPGVLSPTPAIRPGDEVSQAAYVITPTPTYPAQPGSFAQPSFAQPSFAQPSFGQQEMAGRTPTQPPYSTGQMVPVQLPSGQIVSMQYPTGQMAPLQYPTGQMAPYPTGQLQTGTTNPPYAVMHAPPQDTTAALLAMSTPNRRRWMIIGGAAVLASVLLLVIVIATRGSDKTATAATTTPSAEKKADRTASRAETGRAAEDKPAQKVTMAVTAPETPTPAPVPPAGSPDDEESATGDPSSPPVVGSGPCKLTVTTTPAGSIVRLDDQVMGPSPITIQSTCARKRVDVKHPRYAPGMKWVNLAADKPASVDIPLNRPTHKVTIISQPAGATVSIAGRRAGTTPTAVQMMGFTKVALTIEKKGYKTVVESIYSKVDGERRTVTLTKAK